jgi:hypothetical protein
MPSRTLDRPSASYLLRVHEVRVKRVVRQYELLELATGLTLRFASLRALQRHLLRAQAASTVAEPGGRR